MALIGQNHKFSSSIHNEELISYLQAEALKAEVTSDTLGAAFLKLESN
jgi:hypothetical protein